MVGSGGSASDRSKDAVGMMALHEALRTVCLNSEWTYSVFWTIRPRPRVRGGNGCKVGDDNGSLMLMWEDGFCRGRVSECVEEIEGEDPVRKAFSKMSIQLYNYGEGLMGKVASDKCHKWVFKEPTECDPNISNYWQSSFDALPQEWTDQFESGIQTIAVIQAGHGLLQLGSCKIIPEDLHFVLRMRHTFESLGYQSGFYLSQLFSASRATSSPPSPAAAAAINHHNPLRPPPPPPLFPFPQSLHPPHRTLPSPTTAVAAFQPHAPRLGPFLHNPSSEPPRFDGLMAAAAASGGGVGEHENDIRWPSGMSFFNALTGRAEEAAHKHLLNPDGTPNPGEFLGLDSCHVESDGRPKMEKFKRSITMPARVAPSSSPSPSPTTSASVDHHNQPLEYRNSGGGMYRDVMETFLE